MSRELLVVPRSALSFGAAEVPLRVASLSASARLVRRVTSRVYFFGRSAESLPPFRSHFGPSEGPLDRSRAYVDPQLRRDLKRLGREIVAHHDAMLRHELAGQHVEALREEVELRRVQRLHVERTRQIEAQRAGRKE